MENQSAYALVIRVRLPYVPYIFTPFSSFINVYNGC